MSDNTDDKIVLKDEGDLYLELGNLIKKNRPLSVKKDIKILVDDATVSIEEKIKKIKEMDEKVHLNSNLYLLKKNALKNKLISGDDDTVSDFINDEIRSELSSRGIFIDRTVSEQRQRIRKHIRRSSYFSFAFYEFANIIGFAKKTGVIDYTIFLPSARVSRSMEPFFNKRVMQNASELLKLLTPVEEKGWAVLTKFEYNLCIELKFLCHKIVELSKDGTRAGDKSFFVKLRRIENQYFTLLFSSSYFDIIKTSIIRFLEVHKDLKENIKFVEGLVASILQPAKAGPSLYDLILGINIIDSARFIGYEDLINKELKAVINNYDYNAPKEVKRQIRQYIESNINALNHLEKQRNDINSIKCFLSIDSDNIVTYDPLDRFFRISRLRKTFEEAAPSSNIMEFIDNFLSEFLRSFTDFFVGTIKLEDSGEAAIFDQSCFQDRIIELEHITDKFKRLKKVLDHMFIDRSRLVKILNSNITLDVNKSKGEVDLIVEIKRISEFIFKFASSLSDMYLNRIKYAQTTTPITPIALQKGPCTIPHSDKKLFTDDILNNETVTRSIEIIIGLLFSAAHYMENSKIIGLISNEDYIKDETVKIIAILERLANPLEYDNIKETYNI